MVQGRSAFITQFKHDTVDKNDKNPIKKVLKNKSHR